MLGKERGCMIVFCTEEHLRSSSQKQHTWPGLVAKHGKRSHMNAMKYIERRLALTGIAK